MRAGHGPFDMHFDGVYLGLYDTGWAWDYFVRPGRRRTGSVMVLDLPSMSRSGYFISL
jgi:hypothetical protein